MGSVTDQALGGLGLQPLGELLVTRLLHIEGDSRGAARQDVIGPATGSSEQREGVRQEGVRKEEVREEGVGDGMVDGRIKVHDRCAIRCVSTCLFPLGESAMH